MILLEFQVLTEHMKLSRGEILSVNALSRISLLYIVLSAKLLRRIDAYIRTDLIQYIDANHGVVGSVQIIARAAIMRRMIKTRINAIFLLGFICVSIFK